MVSGESRGCAPGVQMMDVLGCFQASILGEFKEAVVTVFDVKHGEVCNFSVPNFSTQKLAMALP